MIDSGIARRAPLACNLLFMRNCSHIYACRSSVCTACLILDFHSLTHQVYVKRCTTTAFCSLASSTVCAESESSLLGKVVCKTKGRASGRALGGQPTAMPIWMLRTHAET